MERLIEVDGSLLGRSGQHLLVAVSLSIITQRPVYISNFRAGMYSPGLTAPQISGIQLLAEISRARVEGLNLGSQALVFYPGVPEPGSYSYTCPADIATAEGGTTSLLQAVLPVLARLNAPSELELRGSTDAPPAPSTNFVQRVMQPALAMMGVQFDFNVVNWRLSFDNSGLLQVRVHPAAVLPLHLVEKSQPSFAARILLKPIPGADICGMTDANYLNSLFEVVESTLGISREDIPVERTEGTHRFLVLDVWAHCGPHVTLHQTGFENFAKNVKPLSPRMFTRETCQELLSQTQSPACVDDCLQTQVLIFAAIASGPSTFAIHRLTPESEGTIDLIRGFELATIRVENNQIHVEPNNL